MKCRAIEVIKDFRRDAESPSRDHIGGVRMLRIWLRSLQMELTSGWDQDTPQDEIAELLGEYPRGHEREFKVK